MQIIIVLCKFNIHPKLFASVRNVKQLKALIARGVLSIAHFMYIVVGCCHGIDTSHSDILHL